MKKVCNIWAMAYILLLLIVIPLYVENNYFNILEAKSRCYIVICAVMLPIGLVLFIIAHRKDRIKTIGRFPLDIPVIAFAVMAFVSSLVSETLGYSFFGTLGWRVGSLTWLTLAASYLLISRCLTKYNNIWLPIIVVNIVIIIFAILHAAEVDVFSMHVGVIAKQVFSYYSTIGQKNWWIGYLCLLMPIALVFFMETEKKSSKIIWYVFWFFLCMAVVVAASDGIFVGIGLCAFFAVPFVFKKQKRIADFGWLIAAYGVCVLILRLFPCFSNRVARIVRGPSKYFTLIPTGLAILIAGIAIGVLCTFVIKGISSKASFVMILVLEILLALVVVFFLIKTVTEFNDKWGTRRGIIWRMSGELWDTFSLKEKLFGIGPEMLKNGYSDLSSAFGETVLVSHSEPLQYLLTTGIFGAVCWLGIWPTAAVVYYKKRKQGYDMPAYFLAMMAYLGQSFVNSAMTTNLVMLFVIMAMFCNDEMDRLKDN